MRRVILFDKVPFNEITREKLITKILKWARGGKKKLVLNMNAYGVVTYLKDRKYARIISKANLIYPDGWGPVFASRFFREKLPERVNVGDFIDELLSALDTNHLGLFLLGCEETIVRNTTLIIKKSYPKIRICGYHSGFFIEKKESEIVGQLKRSQPNIVMVGMGVPNQEYFLDRNWRVLPPAVYMGVGGVFYYITGMKSRAPWFIRSWGFEWLYRLFQEPERLWRRYTLDNLFFGYIFLKSILKGKQITKK